MNYSTYLSIAITVFLLAWTTTILLIRKNQIYSKKLEQNRLETYIKCVQELKERKDQAYKERNILVALLAQVFPSGIKKTAIEGWNPEWHNCVYIELPDGSQCSWHYHDRDSYLFENLPPYKKEWDGHSTENKYFNIEELIVSGSIRKITSLNLSPDILDILINSGNKDQREKMTISKIMEEWIKHADIQSSSFPKSFIYPVAVEGISNGKDDGIITTITCFNDSKK